MKSQQTTPEDWKITLQRIRKATSTSKSASNFVKAYDDWVEGKEILSRSVGDNRSEDGIRVGLFKMVDGLLQDTKAAVFFPDIRDIFLKLEKTWEDSSVEIRLLYSTLKAYACFLGNVDDITDFLDQNIHSLESIHQAVGVELSEKWTHKMLALNYFMKATKIHLDVSDLEWVEAKKILEEKYVPLLGKSIEADPSVNRFGAMLLRAQTYLDLLKYPEAIADYQHIIQNLPSDDDIAAGARYEELVCHLNSPTPFHVGTIREKLKSAIQAELDIKEPWDTISQSHQQAKKLVMKLFIPLKGKPDHEVTSLGNNLFSCRCCGSVGSESKLKRCSACREVFYCSVECQKKDWKNHKEFCNQTKQKLKQQNI